MKCPACKLDNPETSKRCSKCGASMANVGTKSIKREPQPSISEGDCSWMIQFKSNGIVINGRCPACSSENIQKISVIVASGTSAAVTNSNSVGIASNFSESALIQSVGVSTTHTQTGLASALQAPQRLTPTQLMRGHYTGTVEKSLSGIVQHLEKKGSETGNLLGFIFIIERVAYQFSGAILGFIEDLIVSFKYRSEYIKYSNEFYPLAIEDWKMSAFCHKCGHISKFT